MSNIGSIEDFSNVGKLGSDGVRATLKTLIDQAKELGYKTIEISYKRAGSTAKEGNRVHIFDTGL